MARQARIIHLIRETFAAIGRAWSQLWFQDTTTMPLEVARMGIGAALLVHYSMATRHLFEFWGDEGFLPLALALQRREQPWEQSLHFYLSAPWQLMAFHAVFLACCAAFMVGWRTSWVKWIVFIGKVSYDARNPVLPYGVDLVLCALLFIFCISPVGRALSLDRVRAVRAAKRKRLDAVVPAYSSPWAGACIMLMQIQMAVIFFYTAVSKIKWEEWRDGDAVWLVLAANEYYNTFMLNLLSHHYWLGVIATYSTIFIELAYPFLIWQRRTRPFLLAAAVFIHLEFAVFLALIHFSFVMIMGHMSFLRPEWLHRLGAWWKRRSGEMEMIYDGRCGFCVRSMAWLLAFDGLRQIGVRDFRTNPSPVVADAQLEKALYLVRPGAEPLPGFDAYRYVVLRVPGLWWQVPLFYLPVLSRAIGHPIYNWVAANRTRLSEMSLRKLAFLPRARAKP